jgi:ATP-dependent helicase/nuclease subunit B
LPAVVHELNVSASEEILARRLLSDLRAGREGSPLNPAVVAVRSNLVGLQLSRRLAREAGGYANVRFLTLLDLARRLAGPGAGLPAGGERVIFAALAAELAADSYFGPVRERAGFAEALGAAAEDVRQAGLGRWHVDLNLGPKLTSFGRLYDGYRETISEGEYRDEYDLFSAATERAAAGAEILGAGGISVFGFYDFNELQRRLLAALAGRARLRLYMPYGAGGQFRFARATREWLGGLGFREATVDAEEPEGPVRLSSYWYGGSAEPVAVPGATVLSAPDEEREAYEIAREAVRLGRERGVRFAEMAVLYRGESAATVFFEVFQRAGIRCYLAEGEPLAATRAGEGARLLLQIALHAQAGARPYGRAEIMDFVSTAPLASAACGGGAFEPALADEISAAAGIVYGREEWAERLERYAAACEAASDGKRRHEPAAVRALAVFVEGLFDDVERFGAEGRWRDFATPAVELVSKYFEEGSGTEAVLDVLLGTASYDDVVARPVPFKLFCETCARRLAEETVRRGRFEREGVHLIKLDRARGLSFRAVFVPGACEGVYPRAPAQDPVLLDVERAELNDHAGGRWRFNVRAERVAEEPLVFHLALGAAREFLFLSYHRMDGGGRERLPSHYLLKTAGALAGRKFGAEDFDRAASAHPWFRRVGASDAPAPEEALDDTEYWAGLASEEGGDRVAAYLAEKYPRCDAAAAARASYRSGRLTAFDGVIASAEGKSFLAKRYGREVVPASASDLESLAACPRRYFFERILALEAWEEPEELLAMSPLARGRVVHDVLRELYRAPLPDDVPGEVARLVERGLAAARDEGDLPRPFVFEMERRLLSAKLAAYVRADVAGLDDWNPSYFELRFGRRPAPGDDPASTARPFVLDLTGGGRGPTAAEIHGRIDRVDLEGGAAKVLDYKTGRRSRYVGNMDGGRQLQPPLYLMAYAALFGADVGASRAGYCFPLEAGEKCKYVVSEKAPLDEGAVRVLVGGLLALARDGLFVAGREGGGRDVCRYCEFKIICDAARSYLSDEKWAAPEAVRLLELREID